MPEALVTTKRRFYKLLNQVAPPADLVSLETATDADPSVIKGGSRTALEAFDEARARARKRLRLSASSATLTVAEVSALQDRPRSNSATSASDTTRSRQRGPPAFSPWSHEAFLARLRTFRSVSEWHPKPEDISEVEWAKRGWHCVDVNTVRCIGGCECRVVVDVKDSDEGEDLENSGSTDGEDEAGADARSLREALTARYKGLIVDGHSETCLWRKSGCKDDIYHLQVVRPAVWLPQLRQRYQSLTKIEQALADVEIATDSAAESAISDQADKVLRSLGGELGASNNDGGDASLEVNTDTARKLQAKLLTIALHGWRGDMETGTELLRCDACFQRVGLWMYQKDYKPRTTWATEDDNENGDDEADQPTLDCLQLHRPHCPWTSSRSQHASGTFEGLTAAEILQRVVATFAREKMRRAEAAMISTTSGDSSERAFSNAADTRDVGGEGSEHAAGNEQTVNSADAASMTAPYSREEVEKQDLERESRLRRLKKMFTIKRRAPGKIVARPGS